MSAPNDNGTNNPQTVTGGQFGVIIDGSPINQVGVPAGTQVLGPVTFDSPTVTISGDVIANSFTGNFIGNITNIQVANSVDGANVIGPVAFATVANSVAGPNVSGAVSFATTANSVAGANVVGEVSYAAIANSVDGSNVVGFVANAAYANVAGTVANAVQSNITTIGTLTQLDIAGRVNGYLTPLSSNFYDLGTPGNAWRTLYTSNVSAPADGNLSLLGTRVSLGTAANVKLTGGLPGQFLQTTGNGDLLWSAGSSGNGTVGGTNTQIQFNDSGNFGGVAGFTFDSVTGNVDMPNNLAVVSNVSASYFIGNGSQLTDVSAPNANYANFAGTAFSVDAANVVGNVAVANLALSVFGANVSGSVANADYANIAGIAYSVDAANVVGNVAIANTALSVDGANVSGEVSLAATANIANIAYSVDAANIVGNVTVANLALSVSGSNVVGEVAFAAVANSVSGSNVSGEVAFAATANSVAGANVSGEVALANTVSNPIQGNITSVGTLSGLTVNGNAQFNGNLTVDGNIKYVNVEELVVVDPIIQLGGGPNGAPLTSNDGKDRGLQLQYYTTSPQSAFMGWENANSYFVVASNVTVSNNIVTVNEYGNLYAQTFIGNLTGVASNATLANTANVALSVSGSNVVGEVAFAAVANSVAGANVSGEVALAALANIANIAYSVDAANIVGNVAFANVAEFVSNATQSNITSLGTLTALSINGDITGNLIPSANITYDLGSSSNRWNDLWLSNSTIHVGAQTISANATSVVISGNIVGNIPAAETANTANVAEFVSNATQSNITSVGTLSTLSVSGNANIGNIGTAGLITATGNISGGNLSGTLITGTLATANQPNITNVGTLSTLSVSGTANIANLALLKFNETVITGNVSGTITPDVATGSIFNYTLTGNITMDSLSNVVAGTSATLILKQDATGNRTLTSTMKFAGGVNTLSTTANAIDVMGVFYDGSTYYASLTKGYV